MLCGAVVVDIWCVLWWPKIYIPRLPAAASPTELQILQKFTNTSDLETVATALRMHHPGADLELLLHTYSTSVNTPTIPNWPTPTIIALAVVLIINLIHQWIFPCLYTHIKSWKIRHAPPSSTESTAIELATEDNKRSEPAPSVRFVKHNNPPLGTWRNYTYRYKRPSVCVCGEKLK
jgi:hypothetical protein